VKAVNEKTLQLKLNQPNAAFLANAARNLKPVPKHLLEGQKITADHPFTQNPIGVGPYRLKEWVKGDHITLEAKPDYWGKPVCAKLITERIIPDMNALGLALESGSIDHMNPLEPRFVTRFKTNPDIVMYQPPTRVMDALYFNLKNEHLAKPQVRQAIAMSVNVEEFSQRVLSGIQAPTFNPLLKTSWAFDASLKQPSMDLDKAKALLAEAKVPDGFTIKIRTNAGNTTREQMATYTQAQLQKLGIKAEVELQEWGVFFGGVTQGNFDMIVLSTNGGVPDPDTLYSDYHSKGSSNYGKYSNPELDKILEQARLTSNIDERKKLYQQAQAILVKELPRVWAYEYLFDTAFRKNITNVTPSSLGPMWDARYWAKK
jgi:ABC-type transport system substrate-binding protein